MPRDPKVRIVRQFDNVKLDPGGGTTETMIIRFMYGHLGPMELEVPRTISEFDLDQRIEQRIAPFRTTIGN